jgi:hypothetical protein
MLPMLQRWILREPALAFGLPVYGLAGFIFPLHLGWTGTTWLGLAAYLAVAASLLSIADAFLRREDYPGWGAVVPQAVLSLMALAIPAALAFEVGALLGPVDEAIDEGVCATQGEAEADTAAAEADDTFDVTPDCVAGA